MFPHAIETERLRLERLSTETVDPLDLYAVCREGAPGIEAVTRYLPWDPHSTPRESEGFLEGVAERWENREAADYAVRPREGESGAGDLAGLCGLTLDWDRSSAELGIWLRKPFWGRGYSRERAVALAEVAFDRLDLDYVVVRTSVDNDRSIRAVERYVDEMGGRREGRLRGHLVVGGGRVHDELRWSVSHEEFADADPARDVTTHEPP